MKRTPPLRLLTLVFCTGLPGSGCEAPRSPATREAGVAPTPADVLAFMQPRRLQVLPFTKPRSFDSDPIPDGLEVTARVADLMGDPVKVWGTFRFELHEHRPASGDPHGAAVQSWSQAIGTAADQKHFWDRVTQTYRFPLGWEGAPLTPGRKYMLDVSFHPPEGDRIFAEPYTFEFVVDVESLRAGRE